MPIKHTKEDDEESKKVGVLSLVRALTKFLDCIYFRGIFVKWVSLVWNEYIVGCREVTQLGGLVLVL